MKKSPLIKIKGVIPLEEYSANSVDLWLSTGIDPVDFLVNYKQGCGGIPAGRITQIFGPESSGKSTLLAHIIKAALDRDIQTFLFDVENTFDKDFAGRIGLDTKRVGMVVDDSGHPIKSIEDFIQRFHEVSVAYFEETKEGPDDKKVKIRKPDTPLILALDSIAALDVEDMLQKKGGGYTKPKRQVANIARTWGPFYSNVLLPLQKKYKNLTFIALNQLRTNIKTSMFSSEPSEVTPGGRAIKYYASLDLRVDRIKGLLNEAKHYAPYAVVTRVKVHKSKVGSPEVSCYVYNGLKRGFDNAKSVMWFLVDNGILRKPAGVPQLYNCEEFTVPDLGDGFHGPLAGRKLKVAKLTLGDAQIMYDQYGWDALVEPIRKVMESDI